MLESGYHLSMKALKGVELVHHADEGLMIFSVFNKITIIEDGSRVSFKLPVPLYLYIIGLMRLVRRTLRLDKSSIALSGDRASLVVTYGGYIYRYCRKSNKLTKTLKLEQCRTILHMSIAALKANTFLLGEYGRNPGRGTVPIHMSEDGGRTWSTPYLFPENSIRHIHGVYHDHITGHIWVPTGDFNGECYLYEFSDTTFTDPTIHGDGTQIWRTVNLFFTKSSVVWIMDSELDVSHLITLDRGTGSISKGQSFPGPVWYIKTLNSKYHLAQTTVENGEGVQSNSVHLYLSKDLIKWKEITTFPHDGLPLRYCKNAVIAFSNGEQNLENFYMSMEAIKGMDGKSYECSIEEGK